jgi:oxygen-independent coproporphyrinogen-3 oxidase
VRIGAAEDDLDAEADPEVERADRAGPGGEAEPTVPGDRGKPFGVYVHVPFCARRCGYCDFTTYTAAELGGGGDRAEFRRWAIAEIALARRSTGPREAASVYFGGGTPTLLSSEDLAAVLAAIREAWPLAPDAEVTVEANPDSVTEAGIAELARAGVNRLSVGMQSAVPRVLAVLDRTHRPEHVERAVDVAGAAGLETSVDLIYGAPGETMAEWEASLRAAIRTGVGHLSIYALTLEPTTPLARRIARGDLPALDEDGQASKYELADALLGSEGFAWYEISNFARSAAQRSRHNLGYWRGADWWGVGPGAHSGFGGPAPVRWWNVKHPRAWAGRLASGTPPEAGKDEPDAAGRAVERVMLGIRLAEGLPTKQLPAGGRAAVAGLIADGLVDGPSALRGRLVLTLRGRLLADAVTRALIA